MSPISLREDFELIAPFEAVKDMTLDEAKLALRIDTNEFDSAIQGLLDYAPSYIEMATGMSIARQAEYGACKIVTGFLVRLWFLPDEESNTTLRRTIDSLLKTIKVAALTSTAENVATDTALALTDTKPKRLGDLAIFDSDGRIIDSGLDLALLTEFSVGR